MNAKSFLFVMWDGGGTIPPELGIARRLVDRGHRVTVLGEGTMRDEAVAAGCAFEEYRHAFSRKSRRPEDDPLQDFAKKTPIGMIKGARDILMCGRAEDFSRDVTEVAARADFDAIVVDAFLLGAMPGAVGTGLPVAALNPGPEMRPAPGKPPGGMGFKPTDNPLANLRNELMKKMMLRIFAGGLEPMNRARATAGLPLAHPFDQCDELDRYLMLTSGHYDFLPTRLPDNVVYVGAQLDDPQWAEPWQPTPGEGPLCLVTLGSTFQKQQAKYSATIEAFRGLDARALVTLGQVFDREAFDPPPNVEIVRSAPHSQVLHHAAAAVVHGGHGTVMKALAAGCPLVVVPLGRDQFDNGARVEVAGAGIMVKNQTTKNVRAALDTILHDSTYRENAERLGAKIRAEFEEARAIDELESLCEADARPLQRAAAS